MEDRERYRAGERAIAPIVATIIPALIIAVLMVYYRYLPTTQAEHREATPREGRPARTHARDVAVDVDI